MVIHPLNNGLTVLVETMPGVASAAMSLHIPAGVASDPLDAVGVSGIVQEMTLRGAGDRSSRQISDDLDRLGIQRSSTVGVYHARYAAAATAENLLNAIPIYADIVQRPTMHDAGFDPARQLLMQSIEGLDDDPRSRVLVELRKSHWPEPLGRNTMGELAHLEVLTADVARREFARRYTPTGTIIAIAGNVDAKRVTDIIERHFGNWAPRPEPQLTINPATAEHHFLQQESEQTHVGIACPSAGENDPDYYVARVANEVLSGGSAARLFTEIREKRGLCYSVGTTYASLRDRASLLGYAGTSNDRAQAMLDAFVHELKKLKEGVTADEVERSKIGLLSSTVMSSESTSARSGAIAADYFSRGRLRSMEEIIQSISAVTASRVNEFVRQKPLGPFTVVTVGPKELKTL